ncbi:MAG TPA: peptidoglycan-binding protein, partial [Ilumatobacteraceae bacterium]
MSRRVIALTITFVVVAVALIAVGATLWVRAGADADNYAASDARAVPSTVEIDDVVPRTTERSQRARDGDGTTTRSRRRSGATTSTSTTVPTRPECTVDRFLFAGIDAPQVECLEGVLAFDGYLDASADTVYDDAAVAAVQAFQADHGLLVDGVVGPLTAVALGVWTEA